MCLIYSNEPINYEAILNNINQNENPRFVYRVLDVLKEIGFQKSEIIEYLSEEEKMDCKEMNQEKTTVKTYRILRNNQGMIVLFFKVG